jgi:hypothetical protein
VIADLAQLHNALVIAHSRQRSTNSSSLPSFTTQLVCVYGAANRFLLA